MASPNKYTTRLLSEFSLEELIRLLFPLDSGYIEFRAIELKSNTVKAREWFKPQDTEAIEKWATNCLEHEWDVYFGVAARHKKGSGSKTNLEYVSAVWADIDVEKNNTNKPDIFHYLLMLDPQPSIIIDSGGGFHTYWLLVEPTNEFKRIEAINKKITYKLQNLGIPADPNVWDAARILRPAGTCNFKYNPPRSVRIIHLNDAHYSLEVIETLRMTNNFQKKPFSKYENNNTHTYTEGDKRVVILKNIDENIDENVLEINHTQKDQHVDDIDNSNSFENTDITVVDINKDSALNIGSLRLSCKELFTAVGISLDEKINENIVEKVDWMLNQPGRIIVDNISDAWSNYPTVWKIYSRMLIYKSEHNHGTLYNRYHSAPPWVRINDTDRVIERTSHVPSVTRTETRPSVVFLKSWNDAKQQEEIVILDFGLQMNPKSPDKIWRTLTIQEVVLGFLYGEEEIKRITHLREKKRDELFGQVTALMVEMFNVWPRQILVFTQKASDFMTYVVDEKIPRRFEKVMWIVLKRVIFRARYGHDEMLSARELGKLTDVDYMIANKALNLLATYGLIRKTQPKNTKTGTTWLIAPVIDFDLEKAKRRFRVIHSYLQSHGGYSLFSRKTLKAVGLGNLISDIFKRDHDPNEKNYDLPEFGEILRIAEHENIEEKNGRVVRILDF